jgi:hypothetical protein
VALIAACSGDPSAPAAPTPVPSPSPLPPPSPAPPATLTGLVTNESGARLSALVQVAEGTGRGRSVSTNAEGVYTLSDVGPGTLTVRAASKGYRDQFVPVVALGVTPLDFRMQLLPKGVLTGRVTDIDSGALRRAPSAETFTGRIGWAEGSSCVYPDSTGPFATTQYPCAGPTFSMRRGGGAIDVTVSWDVASESALRVHVIRENFGVVREVRAAAGSNRRLAFSQTAFWPGAWSIRVIDMENGRAAGTGSTITRAIPFSVTITRWD